MLFRSRRVAECPAGVVTSLKELTVEVALPVSVVLAEIADARVPTLPMDSLRACVDVFTFLVWIQDDAHLAAWRQLIQGLNRIPSVPENEDLGPNLRGVIKSTCERAVKAFADGAGAEQHLKAA